MIPADTPHGTNVLIELGGETVRTRTYGSPGALPGHELQVNVEAISADKAALLSDLELDPDPSPPPPYVENLEFAQPSCSRCGEEVDGDGTHLWCDSCDLVWGADGRDGCAR